MLFLNSARALRKSVRHPRIFAGGGYAGRKMARVIWRTGTWKLEIVKRSDAAGFEVLPKRSTSRSDDRSDNGSPCQTWCRIGGGRSDDMVTPQVCAIFLTCACGAGLPGPPPFLRYRRFALNALVLPAQRLPQSTGFQLGLPYRNSVDELQDFGGFTELDAKTVVALDPIKRAWLCRPPMSLLCRLQS